MAWHVDSTSQDTAPCVWHRVWKVYRAMLGRRQGALGFLEVIDTDSVQHDNGYGGYI